MGFCNRHAFARYLVRHLAMEFAMKVGQVITWLDGQQTQIMNEAELAMLQYVLWDLDEEVL